MIVSPCTNDTDCPGAFVCYASVHTWHVDPTAPNGGKPGCLCSTWYGNTGNDCTSYDSPTAHYWISLTIINAIISFLLAIIAAIDLARLCRISTTKKLDPQQVCFIQLVMGHIAMTIGEILFAVQPFTPNLFAIDAKSEKTSIYQDPSYALMLLGGCGIYTASCSIALLWMDLANSSKRLKAATANTLKSSRTPLMVLEVVFVACMLITLFASATVYLPFVALLFEFIIFGLFIAGYIGIRAVLHTAISFAAGDDGRAGGGAGGSSETNKFTAILDDIKRTVMWIILSQLAVLVFGIISGAYAFMNWKETCGAPGTSNVAPPIVVTRLVVTCICMVGANVLWYNHKTTTRRMKRSSKDTSSAGTGLHGHGTDHQVQHHSSSNQQQQQQLSPAHVLPE